MLKCKGSCAKEKPEADFINDKGKILKNCSHCRENTRIWKQKNKERLTAYNKLQTEKKHNNRETVNKVFAKLVTDTDDKWIEYDTQRSAAIKLGLYVGNVNKVIKGSLGSTGGYMFKIESIKNEKKELETWDEKKKNIGIEDLQKGRPSNKRIPHEFKDGIEGKTCYKCKEWKNITGFNNYSYAWDKLRYECKDCLNKYRLENRRKIQDTMNIYEKKRKIVDPVFKLTKTLRSRLGSVVRNQNVKKSAHTIELVGCSANELRDYLSSKFENGMTWENHGEWHIDHIFPCSSWDLSNEIQQKLCFHYTNLQPMWGKDNMVKNNKFNQDDKDEYIKNHIVLKKNGKKYVDYILEDDKEEMNLHKEYMEYLKRRNLTEKERTIILDFRSKIKDLITNENSNINCIDLIGCTKKDFFKHLESFFEDNMWWDNYGEWCIGHVFPYEVFNLEEEEGKRLCFNYKNITPVWAKDEPSIADKVTKEQKDEYIRNYNKMYKTNDSVLVK